MYAAVCQCFINIYIIETEIRDVYFTISPQYSVIFCILQKGFTPIPRRHALPRRHAFSPQPDGPRQGTRPLAMSKIPSRDVSGTIVGNLQHNFWWDENTSFLRRHSREMQSKLQDTVRETSIFFHHSMLTFFFALLLHESFSKNFLSVIG